jgi:hypothetical protein
MELSLLLIILGIIIAVLVDPTIGTLCVVVGLILLVWPRLTSRRV